jgi:hypothetical protein
VASLAVLPLFSPIPIPTPEEEVGLRNRWLVFWFTMVLPQRHIFLFEVVNVVEGML